MPQYVNGKLYNMHGEGSVPIGPAIPWRGGVFGQPPLPQPRAGIFTAHWPLPWQAQTDNTIGPRHNLLPDRYMRSSGWPVYGLGDNQNVEYGAGRGMISRLVAGGVAPLRTAMSVEGATSMAAANPAILGALIGAIGAGKGKRLKGGLLGALLGIGGKMTAQAVSGPTAMGAQAGGAATGGLAAALFLRR